MNNDDRPDRPTNTRAHDILTRLIQLKTALKDRLIYQEEEGNLSKESQALYNAIESTLHEAYGELYGWKEEDNPKDSTKTEKTEVD